VSLVRKTVIVVAGIIESDRMGGLCLLLGSGIFLLPLLEKERQSTAEGGSRRILVAKIQREAEPLPVITVAMRWNMPLRQQPNLILFPWRREVQQQRLASVLLSS
jgi:hypothetical protein